MTTTTNTSVATTPATATRAPDGGSPVRRLSLLKPTGHLTLGNYLGAIRTMAAEADAAAFYGIADLHALTVPHEPAQLRALVREMQALLLAAAWTLNG